MSWQLLVPTVQKYYSLNLKVNEVILSPFSNCMDCLDLSNPNQKDFSRPPPGAKPGSYNMTRMEVWSDDHWLNGVKIWYSTGFVQEWGSFVGTRKVLEGLLYNPITALSYAAEKNGADHGQFVGFMRGLEITRKTGEVASECPRKRANRE